MAKFLLSDRFSTLKGLKEEVQMRLRKSNPKVNSGDTSDFGDVDLGARQRSRREAKDELSLSWLFGGLLLLPRLCLPLARLMSTVFQQCNGSVRF